MRVHHIHTTGLQLSRLLARLGQLRSVIEGLGLPFDGAVEAHLAVEVAVKLWRWASAGRFGLAVQLAIYRDLGGTDRYAFDTWQAFCYHTGWIVPEPIGALSAPPGHLPWLTRPDTMGRDSHDAKDNPSWAIPPGS